MSRSSWTPFSVAAIWARRSAMLLSGLRDGWTAERSRSSRAASRRTPSSTSSQLSMSTPSSSTRVLNAGMDPGVIPPISAWWPRAATTKSSSLPARSNTGVTTVMSGRWVPPWYGSLSTYTCPGLIRPALRRSTIRMLSPIDPKWTGMCGALAIRLPSASKRAQEKSSRSLMLTEWAVLRRRSPICSATDMKRLLKISSSTGSTSVDALRCATRGRWRCSWRWPRSVTVARQSGSTNVVALASAMIAGPSTVSPGAIASRR